VLSIRVRSRLPGRVRWEVPVLRNQPALAQAVGVDLGAHPHVTEASANGRNGSVLLRFSPVIDAAEAEGWVRAALERQLIAWDATGLAPAVRPDPASAGEGPSPLKRLLAATSRHRSLRTRAMVAGAADGLAEGIPPVLIGLSVDTVTRGSASLLARVGLQAASSRLFALGGIGAAAWAIATGLEYWHERTAAELANVVRHDLRNEIYQHIQTLDIAEVESRDGSDWLAVLDKDVQQVHSFIYQGADPIVSIASNLVIVGTTFMLASPMMAAAQLLMVPPLVLVSMAMLGPIRQRHIAARNDAERLESLLTGNVTGMSTIAGFNAQDREAARVFDASERHVSSVRHANRLDAAYVPSMRAVVGGGFVTTLVWGGSKVSAGTLSAGTLDTMAYSQLRLMASLARAGVSLEEYQKTSAALERIYATLDAAPSVVSGPRALPRKTLEGALAFEDVDFGYDPTRPVLDGLTLRCPAGRTTAIVGSTGAGKSTLLKLLLRFYDPQAGVVTIDGIDVRDIKLEDLRESMSFVSQQITLFAGSIRDNIAYGRPHASLDEVIAAARTAEAHDFIMDLPDGYDTAIGFGGLTLSGGQRQRLAIARAVLADRPILLFDEATSSLDYVTEAAIQRSLAAATHERTTVIIAHRLSTIRHADVIYVLEDGRVCESGSHDELVAADGLYAGMWKVQTGESARERPARRKHVN
jgi:ATP-binding cassette subfamily B protein